ncbi:hypothetical protein ABEQ93_12170 [Cutibacterium acnes]
MDHRNNQYLVYLLGPFVNDDVILMHNQLSGACNSALLTQGRKLLKSLDSLNKSIV